MRLVFKVIMFCTPILMLSCIQDYDIDFDNSDKILTLNAEISDGQPVEVLIALPKKPNQLGDFFTPSDAEVILYENGELFEQLSFKQSTDTSFGVYISEKKITPENSYTIEATYGGLPMISAYQKVPSEPIIRSFTFGKEFSQINNNDTLPVKIGLVSDDFYSKYIAVFAYWDIDVEVTNENGVTELQNQTYRIDAFDDGTGFRDYKRNWVKALSPTNDFDFNLFLTSTENFKSDSVKSIQLIFFISALTEDGYLYRETYRRRGKDNFGEPAIIHSNIKNGLGIFSATSSIRKKFKLK